LLISWNNLEAEIDEARVHPFICQGLSPMSTVSDTGAPLTHRVSAALDEVLARETELS
jgi:hypothetical protein